MPNTVYKDVKQASKKLPELKDLAKDEVKAAKDAKKAEAEDMGFLERHFTSEGRARMERAETAIEQAKLDVKTAGELKAEGKSVKEDVGQESSKLLFFHDDKKLSDETKSRAAAFTQTVSSKEEEIKERMARLEGIAETDQSEKSDAEMEAE